MFLGFFAIGLIAIFFQEYLNGEIKKSAPAAKRVSHHSERVMEAFMTREKSLRKEINANISQFFDDVLPLELRNRPWYSKFWIQMLEKHPYIAYLAPAEGRVNYTAKKWMCMSFELLNLVFIDSLFAPIAAPDPEVCTKLTTASACMKPSSIDLIHSLCDWDVERNVCIIRQVDENAGVIIIIVLIIKLVEFPLMKFCEYLVDQVANNNILRSKVENKPQVSKKSTKSGGPRSFVPIMVEVRDIEYSANNNRPPSYEERPSTTVFPFTFDDCPPSREVQSASDKVATFAIDYRPPSYELKRASAMVVPFTLDDRPTACEIEQRASVKVAPVTLDDNPTSCEVKEASSKVVPFALDYRLQSCEVQQRASVKVAPVTLDDNPTSCEVKEASNKVVPFALDYRLQSCQVQQRASVKVAPVTLDDRPPSCEVEEASSKVVPFALDDDGLQSCEVQQRASVKVAPVTLNDRPPSCEVEEASSKVVPFALDDDGLQSCQVQQRASVKVAPFILDDSSQSCDVERACAKVMPFTLDNMPPSFEIERAAAKMVSFALDNKTPSYELERSTTKITPFIQDDRPQSYEVDRQVLFRLAARLCYMQRKIDDVTLDEEVDYLKTHADLQVKSEAIEKLLSALRVKSSLANPMNRDKLRSKVHRARKMCRTVLQELEEKSGRDEKEIYLVKRFIVELLSGVHRWVAERFFFDEIESEISVLYRGFCTILLMLIISGELTYVFLTGVDMGANATRVWFICLAVVVMQGK